MGAIKLDQENGSLEITYGGRECPFGGVDSSAPDPYIGPGQLTQDSINGLVNNNSLLATFFNTISFAGFNQALLGYGELNGQIFYVEYANGLINVHGVPNFPDTTGIYTIGSIDTTAVYGTYLNINWKSGSLTYKNINGVCYFSFSGSPFIYQHNNVNASLLTTYLGASYLSELNGRLIAANVWKINATQASYVSSSFSSSQTNQATQSGVGTATTNSPGLGGFPSQAVGAGQFCNLAVTISGGFSCTQGAVGCTGTVALQYSDDSGVTWNTYQSWGLDTVNQAIPQQTISIPNIPVANISSLQVRTVVTATAIASTVASTVAVLYSSVATIITTASLVINNYPYQFAWSAPQGAYSQFNALTTQNGVSVVTGAGFNNLPDVEDSITGLITTGPTLFVLRGQGITEVSPLNSGINPFNFDHLWASHKGIGTIYPNTVAQYGSLGGFFSDTDIFTIGYSGLNSISFKALSGIYKDLIGTCQGNLLCGGMGSLYVNGEVTNVYILAACDTSNTPTIYIWMFNFRTNEWFRFQNTYQHAIVGLQFTAVNLSKLQFVNSYNTIFLMIADNESASFILCLPTDGSLPNFNTPSNWPQPVSAKLVLQAEEILPLRDISIDSILLYYNASETTATKLVVNLNVNGIAFEPLDDANDIVDGNWHYAKLSPTNGTPYMGNSPQLTINVPLTPQTGKNSIQFGKIVLLGGVDVSQRPL